MHEEAQMLSKREDKFILRMLDEARRHQKNNTLDMFMARRFDSIMCLENIVFNDLIRN